MLIAFLAHEHLGRVFMLTKKQSFPLEPYDPLDFFFNPFSICITDIPFLMTTKKVGKLFNYQSQAPLQNKRNNYSFKRIEKKREDSTESIN